MADFLPPAGPGRVLITSQNRAWPGRMLEVPGLDRGAAAGFLISRTGDPDRQAAADLAAELGGLPLALEQAAAYVVATGQSLADYLALFRQRRPEMPTRGEPAGPDKSVAVSWCAGFQPTRAGQPVGGRACCGCWRSARPRRSRCRCCCDPALGSPASSGRTWHQCLCRCWRTRWQPVKLSRRCAGIRWSPRLPTGRCRCTGWCRPSPSIR